MAEQDTFANDKQGDKMKDRLDTSTAEGFRHVIEHCNEHGFGDLVMDDGDPSSINNIRQLLFVIKNGNVYRIKEPRQPKENEVWENRCGHRAWYNGRSFHYYNGMHFTPFGDDLEGWTYVCDIDLSALKEQDHD